MVSRPSATSSGVARSRFERRSSRRRLIGPLVLVVVGLGLLVPFLLLGHAARVDRPYHWDTSASGYLQRHERATQDSAADRIPDLIVENGAEATLAVGLVLVAILIILRRVREAAFLVATGVTIVIATPLLKEQFEGPNPNTSFPSGHAARFTALATAAILIAWPSRFRWPTVVLGILGTAALGLALVYEDWHSLSDVLGGWYLGAACAGVLWLAISAATRRPELLRRAPPPPR
jgi:membrane-associated phospholipid phosphatase